MIPVFAIAASLALCGQSRAALSKTSAADLDAGLHHLYNLDYDDARADFRKIIAAEPGNPFGYLFESGAIWWQSSMEYGLFKDTPTLEGLFEQDVNAALRKAGPLESSRDKETKADGNFVEGMAFGTRGQWSILRGHWLMAYFDGKRAVKHLKKALKLESDYYDADLGLGVFDYQAAHFGGMLKLGSELIGVRGDEKRGLELIELASQKARYGSRQAAQFLASIYIDDKHDYARALPIIQRLRRDFPESVYFEFLELALRYKLGQTPPSLALGRDLFAKVKDDPETFNRKLLSLFCGNSNPCLNHDDVAGALAWLDEAVAEARQRDEDKPKPKKKRRRRHAEAAPAVPDPDEQWQSLLHVFRGYAHDVMGERDDAELDYRWVLAHPGFSDDAQRARECLAKACGADKIMLYLRARSRGEPWPAPAAVKAR